MNVRIARGKVVGKKTVELDGELPEGSQVTVYADDAEWELDEVDTLDLLQAMAEADRGETVTAEEVFAALPPRK